MSESFVQPAQMDASKRTWLIASSCAGAVGGLAVERVVEAGVEGLHHVDRPGCQHRP